MRTTILAMGSWKWQQGDNNNDSQWHAPWWRDDENNNKMMGTTFANSGNEVGMATMNDGVNIERCRHREGYRVCQGGKGKQNIEWDQGTKDSWKAKTFLGDGGY
jgi:hypothetical protein